MPGIGGTGKPRIFMVPKLRNKNPVTMRKMLSIRGVQGDAWGARNLAT